ncbi:UNVERIFIED_CONTAM: hypothetical protein FKN15_058395 [Acipenser sinensis]
MGSVIFFFFHNGVPVPPGADLYHSARKVMSVPLNPIAYPLSWIKCFRGSSAASSNPLLISAHLLLSHPHRDIMGCCGQQIKWLNLQGVHYSVEKPLPCENKGLAPMDSTTATAQRRWLWREPFFYRLFPLHSLFPVDPPVAAARRWEGCGVRNTEKKGLDC